jgi:hypothetical protein
MPGMQGIMQRMRLGGSAQNDDLRRMQLIASILQAVKSAGGLAGGVEDLVGGTKGLTGNEELPSDKKAKSDTISPTDLTQLIDEDEEEEDLMASNALSVFSNPYGNASPFQQQVSQFLPQFMPQIPQQFNQMLNSGTPYYAG